MQNGFIARDSDSGWIIIHQFLDWNSIDNPNQDKSIRRLFDQVPENSSAYQFLVNVLLALNKYLDDLFKFEKIYDFGLYRMYLEVNLVGPLGIKF